MKKYILMIVSSLMLVSCLDTIILPDDKTVDEDFWKTKEDVSSMVNAAYAAMASEDVITRLIIWGDYRSDELVRSSSLSGTIIDALDEMAAVNIQTSNQFATWAAFYDVINKCNIVLERAEAVQQVDPSYTEYDYESDRCQMLALRSLCYFYLVRNFHDVPYVTEAFMNSSQNTQYEQSSPEYVISQLIETLEEVSANPNALRSNSFTTSEWRRVGWMTLDGVNALLADIYLWRASVLHSAADYQKCADYCQLVIDSKRAQHVRDRNELQESLYPLTRNINSGNAFRALYVDQNGEESIFELQSKSNVGLCKYFYKYSNNNSTEGYLKASSVFGQAASTLSGVGAATVFAVNDLRFYNACYFDSKTDGGSFDVRKMVSTVGLTAKTQQVRSNDRAYDSYDQNYIIYRLPDVMLMQAEAMTQLLQATPADATDSVKNVISEANAAQLQQIFNLVQAVNSRSLHSDNVADSMKWTTYRRYSKDQMETLILQERLRELCFEGKRWYDLLRYNYRHIEGVQYGRTFGEMAETAETSDSNLGLPAVYKEMLKLMTRSRGTDASAIQAKMHNEAYLYLPIPEADFNVCPLLRQNPAYQSTNAYEKQY